MSEPTMDEQSEIVQRSVDWLREHFDHVQVLVSKDLDNGNTRFIKRGSGNHHACIGMCRELLIHDDENARLEMRGPNKNGGDDSDGAWINWL